jgi:hypothetical protein
VMMPCERHGGKLHRSHDLGRGRINVVNKRRFIKKNHDIHLIIERSGIWT